MNAEELVSELGEFLAQEIFESRFEYPIPAEQRGKYGDSLHVECLAIRWFAKDQNFRRHWSDPNASRLMNLVSDVAWKRLVSKLDLAGEPIDCQPSFTSLRAKYFDVGLGAPDFYFEANRYDEEGNEILVRDPILAMTLKSWALQLANMGQQMPGFCDAMVAEIYKGNLKGGVFKSSGSGASGPGCLIWLFPLPFFLSQAIL
jgi:hypothetical protein